MEENIAPEEFAAKIRGMEKEEFDTLLDELPEEMKTNPKQFFKLVKAVGGISKAGVLVKEVITEDGASVTAEIGGSQIIKDLSCPGKPVLGNPISDAAWKHCLDPCQNKPKFSIKMKLLLSSPRTHGFRFQKPSCPLIGSKPTHSSRERSGMSSNLAIWLSP